MSRNNKITTFFYCLLLFSCGQKPELDSPIIGAEISWSDDIAKIVFKNCSPCHRPNQSGPFTLMNYWDVVKKAKLIKFVTQTGYMPPWPADISYTHFVGERGLSKKEIELLRLWINNGLKRGDSLKEPAVQKFYNGSYFRKPDLIINMKKSVFIKGNGTDAFLIFKFPYQLKKDTIIDFVEFVPDHRKLIHHVNGHLINYDEKRKFNYFGGEFMHEDTKSDLISVYKKMQIPYTDYLEPHFPTLTLNTVYYLPGYLPPNYPKSIGGFRMKKNGIFLLNNIHYGPSNIDVLDSSSINVFFRKTPIKRPIIESQMGTFGISKIEPDFIIPPNEIKKFHTQSTLSKKISLLSVNPHMHLIGKSFWAFALKINGDTIPLIRIKKWDFRWQYYYTYKHPIVLEKGTVIHVYGTFDNTNSNSNNPFHPPQTIKQGDGAESMKTSEEMFQFIFTYMNYQVNDENIDLDKQ